MTDEGPTDIEEIANVVGFLRGRHADARGLLRMLGAEEPLPTYVKDSLLAAIRPMPRGRQYGTAPPLIFADKPGFYPPENQLGFAIFLRPRRGAPSAAMKQQDFAAVFSDLPLMSATLSAVSASDLERINRARFAQILEANVDTDKDLRSRLYDAFDQAAETPFCLRVWPREKRAPKRPKMNASVRIFAAHVARQKLDQRSEDLLTSKELEGEAKRQRIKPETLLKRVYRFAPRRPRKK